MAASIFHAPQSGFKGPYFGDLVVKFYDGVIDTAIEAAIYTMDKVASIANCFFELLKSLGGDLGSVVPNDIGALSPDDIGALSSEKPEEFSTHLDQVRKVAREKQNSQASCIKTSEERERERISTILIAKADGTVYELPINKKALRTWTNYHHCSHIGSNFNGILHSNDGKKQCIRIYTTMSLDCPNPNYSTMRFDLPDQAHEEYCSFVTKLNAATKGMLEKGKASGKDCFRFQIRGFEMGFVVSC